VSAGPSGVLINTGFTGILGFALLTSNAVIHAGRCWLSSVAREAVVPSKSVDKKLFWEKEVKQIERGVFLLLLFT